MRQLLFYFILGLAAALFILLTTQRLAGNLKTSLHVLQEQRLQDQMNWEQERPEVAREQQIQRIETYADVITEQEADYIEMMGHHSPNIRDQFPHLTMTELWDAIYQKELDHLNTHGLLSQRVLNQIKESKDQAQAIKRIFSQEEQAR